MTNENPTIKPIAYKYGLYLGLLTIISLATLYLLNIESHWIASVLSTIITVVIFFYGISDYKKLNSNTLSISDGLKTGMAMALVGGIISAIYAAIHYSLIMPEFLASKKEEAIEAMRAQTPNSNGDQLETAMQIIDVTTSEFFICTMMLLGSLFFGFIVSLIISAILKN